MKILSKTGKKWSKVSTEIESMFVSWLEQSGIEKQDFLERICKDSFEILYSKEKDGIGIYLNDNAGAIGLPFIWIKNGSIPLAYFKTDAALILIYISSLCNNDKSKKKIEDFIKIYKLDK